MSFSFNVYVNTSIAPPEAVLSSLTITHGRTDPTTQPAPGVATVTFMTDDSIVEYYTPGASIVISAITGVEFEEWTIFTGRITDVTMDRNLIVVNATSDALGQLAKIVRKVTSPAATIYVAAVETFWDIVEDYLSIVYFGYYNYYEPPSGSATWPLVEVDWPRQPALQTMQALISNDPAGVLVENPRQNYVLYIMGSQRREFLNTPYTVNAGAIVDEWVATKSLSTKANRVKVTWGTEQNVARAKDDDDINLYYLYDREITSNLAESADASVYARWVLARSVTPGWNLPAITVDMDRWTNVQDWLQNALVTRVLELEETPSALIPSKLCVEGWTYRFNGRSFYADFYVSDPANSRLPQRWLDLENTNPTLAWEDVDPTYTWDTLLTTDL